MDHSTILLLLLVVLFHVFPVLKTSARDRVLSPATVFRTTAPRCIKPPSPLPRHLSLFPHCQRGFARGLSSDRVKGNSERPVIEAVVEITKRLDF